MTTTGPKAPSKVRLFVRRLVYLALRVLYRLRWAPFTLLYVMINAAHHAVRLRRRLVIVPVAEAGDGVENLPRNAMIWLDRVLAGPPEHHFDVCLRLNPESADANLHDLLSAALAFPRLRSVGLYWDTSSLADDLPLWRGSRDGTPCDLGSPGVARLGEFLQADHGEIALPVAASRDAETLLKRRVGSAWAVCLNLPAELSGLGEAIASARTDIHFFDLSPSDRAKSPVNHESFYADGFTLHERMALVLAADAYVGRFDELGCAALIAKQQSLLLGDGEGKDSLDSAAALKRGLEFLSRHFRSTT